MRSRQARPSSCGMRMSSSTTSGLVWPISGSTWLPSVAAPTTSMSSAPSRAQRMPSSVSRWSSASRTLIVVPPWRWGMGSRPEREVFGRLVCVLERTPFGQGHGDAGGPAGRAAHVERAAQQERALVHPDEAHPAALGGAHEGALQLEAAAVVLDLGAHGAVRADDGDADAVGAAVLAGVRERLLHDAQKRDPLRAGERVEVALEVD